jgi:hypothetical protein
MGNDSFEATWLGSRTEAAVWGRIMQTRRSTDMPGELLVTALGVRVQRRATMERVE